MVDEYKKEGYNGNSHPATEQQVVRQAVAIALTKAGKTRRQMAKRL